MPDYRLTATLAPVSGDTADVNVNGFHISKDTPITGGDYTAWANAVKAFYDDLVDEQALRGRAQTGHSVKIYANDTSVPNYPIYESAFALSSDPGGVDLPQEVALCISYANDSANSVPRGRRRGRIYISGWTEATNFGGRPYTDTCADVVDAFDTYCGTMNALTDVSATIWSPTELQSFVIERAWVDNEWDTMRSRGTKATVRETRTI